MSEQCKQRKQRKQINERTQYLYWCFWLFWTIVHSLPSVLSSGQSVFRCHLHFPNSRITMEDEFSLLNLGTSYLASHPPFSDKEILGSDFFLSLSTARVCLTVWLSILLSLPEDIPSFSRCNRHLPSFPSAFTRHLSSIPPLPTSLCQAHPG